jgi:hypothetical protein
MAALSSGMPSTSVYFVLFSRRALIAASLTLAGVSKSGSPADSEMILRPWAFSSRAFVDMAMVWDGEMRFTLSAKKPMAASFELQNPPRGRAKRAGPYARCAMSQGE